MQKRREKKKPLEGVPSSITLTVYRIWKCRSWFNISERAHDRQMNSNWKFVSLHDYYTLAVCRLYTRTEISFLSHFLSHAWRLENVQNARGFPWTRRKFPNLCASHISLLQVGRRQSSCSPPGSRSFFCVREKLNRKYSTDLEKIKKKIKFKPRWKWWLNKGHYAKGNRLKPEVKRI